MALRNGVDNTPGPQTIERMRAVCVNILEPVRAHYGVPFTPSSFYRCGALNQLVGGSPTSAHMRGEAVDFEIPGVDNLTVATWIYKNLVFDQLLLEYYIVGEPTSGWVHCAYTSDRLNQQRAAIITADKRMKEFKP